LARFGNANEHADWETAHHVFTTPNAVHQMLKRMGIATRQSSPCAAVLHGAMALYLARYLNVPPARIPGEGGERLDDLPADAETIRAALLDASTGSGRSISRQAGGTPSHARPSAAGADRHARACVLREDAGFHAYRLLEAGVRQFTAWGDHR